MAFLQDQMQPQRTSKSCQNQDPTALKDIAQNSKILDNKCINILDLIVICLTFRRFVILHSALIFYTFPHVAMIFCPFL